MVSMTKIYLRTRKARFLTISKLKLPNNREVEYIVFTSDDDFLLGQATITGVIIVHEKCLIKQEMLNYVVAHENAHRRSWYNYLAFPIVGFFWFYGLFVFSNSLFYLGVMIATRNIIPIVFFSMSITGIISIAIGCSYSWFIEYKADSIAIQTVGVSNFIYARSLMSNMPQVPLFWKILGRMTHPPPNWTLAIYKFFHKKDRTNNVVSAPK